MSSFFSLWTKDQDFMPSKAWISGFMAFRYMLNFSHSSRVVRWADHSSNFEQARLL